MASAYKTLSSKKRKRDAPITNDSAADENAEPTTTITTTTIISEPSPSISDPPRKTRQRVLILSSRGITSRHRHLLSDLHALLPHSRRESKLDSKSQLQQLNELAELYSCNSVVYFEGRKGKDLYLWLARVPNGPTVKFHVQNLHTSAELNFVGNCLKGSRPVLSFDQAFEGEPYLRVLKQMFTQTFGVPKGHRRGGKPFVDHVMSFSVLDGKVWIRVYEIVEKEREKPQTGEAGAIQDDAMDLDKELDDRNSKTSLSLTEIGPRFVLTPIVIQESSFGGPLIYENRQFVSPNAIRAELRKKRGVKFGVRTDQQVQRLVKRGELGLNTQGGKKRERDAIDGPDLFA